MNLWDFLLMLLVAAIIGSLGQAIAGYSTPGCALSVVIGFLGALVGRFIGHWATTTFKLDASVGLPVHVGNTTFPITWSVLGAALLVLLLRLVMGRRPGAFR